MPFTIDVDPVAFHLGGLALRWYGLILVLGAGLAVWLFMREGRRLRLDEDALSDGIVWVAVAALVGGRALFEIQNELPVLREDPLHALMIWEGGMSFYGGLVAAIGMIVVLARRRGLPLLAVLDAAGPAAAIGQAIGHGGCLITGDSYGLPTSVPWAVIYRNPASMAPHGIALHPTQAYEAIGLGLLFAVLWLGRARLARLGAGAVAGCYLVGLSAVRFGLFFFRDEPSVVLGLKTAQLIGLGIGLAGLLLLGAVVRRHLRAAIPASREGALA